MPTSTRRTPPLLLALALVGAMLPAALAPAAVAATEGDPSPTPTPTEPTPTPAEPTPTVAPAPVDLTVDQAEAEILGLINADRAAVGLIALRLDRRLMAIARARSVDMATKDYFSHQQPDGQNVFDVIEASTITWYRAGEIIAWNNYPGFALSAAGANSGWLGSPSHREIIESSLYNYIGVGVALQASTGKKYWTAVFLQGPDRTPGWAKQRAPRVTAGTRVGRRTITLRWSGADTRLQILTAGLRTFQVQRRVDGGRWRTIAWTRNTALRLSQVRGHRYSYRVRTIDRVGNRGTWSTVGVRI
jgi:uncharacterized protein YkwD